jgi:hypothetical protein
LGDLDLDRLDTYAEVSPSGGDIKAFLLIAAAQCFDRGRIAMGVTSQAPKLVQHQPTPG